MPTVHHHPKFGVIVNNLAEIIVTSSDEALRLLDQGNR